MSGCSYGIIQMREGAAVPSAVEMVTCGRASKDFRIFMPQKLKNQSHAVLLPAHVMLLPVRRAGGLRVGMGGRVLGFGPVLNSIIGVNSRGFSADARFPNTATDQPTATANASPPLPPLSMSIYPS